MVNSTALRQTADTDEVEGTPLVWWAPDIWRIFKTGDRIALGMTYRRLSELSPHDLRVARLAFAELARRRGIAWQEIEAFWRYCRLPEEPR